ncbi:Cerato-platanin-domain-containing protein [Gautieria morchelliformis]|nr:Cerato-platanin-domain-containing protein [Gautieria morchelliformis]
MFPLSSLLVLATSALAVRVSFDPVYDNSAQSVNTVACSGVLASRGFTTFSSIPGFPRIMGAQAVTGFDSPGCLTCWAIVFNNITINNLAIDVATNGFNVAESTMNIFTGGHAPEVGVIDAAVFQACCMWRVARDKTQTGGHFFTNTFLHGD